MINIKNFIFVIFYFKIYDMDLVLFFIFFWDKFFARPEGNNFSRPAAALQTTSMFIYFISQRYASKECQALGTRRCDL